MASPLVRLLEPRFVLDASAVLNEMGQLLVTGSPVESIQLQVDSNGQLSLLDGDQVIEIVNHPGNAGDPLDPTAVTSGEIIFELGDGDDVLDLELPSGLSVTVTASDGDDTTNLQFPGNGLPGANLVDVDSEHITLDSGSSFSLIQGASVRLVGDVFFGSEGARSLVELGSGDLKVDGRLVLAGDVVVIGSGAALDLSEAVITASSTETSLRVDFQQQANSDFSLGGADASGGEFVENVSVVFASNVSLGQSPPSLTGDLSISGDLVIRDVSGLTQFDTAIHADSVLVRTAGDISVDAIGTSGGQILLSTSESLTIGGDLNTASQNTTGAINLLGQSVQLVDSQLTTAGGLVNVVGPVQISGDVQVDSGNSQTADAGGRVQFFGTVQGQDAIGDTLRIDARGASLDGTVRIQRVAGASSATPNAIELNGLEILAGQIEVNSIGVLDGDVSLSAENVRLFGPEIRTSTTGEITVDGALLLPIDDTSISAAGRVQFSSTVKGQTGTQDLQVVAGTDALFDGPVLNVRNLDVSAQQFARFSGTVSLSGDFDVTADTIRIAANVNTTVSVPNGDVRLNGSTLVSVENGAVLMTGTATIHIDAGGGVIDIGGGALRSDFTDDAITLRDASRLVLGNIVAEGGNVTIGIGQDIRGVTDQAAGTRLTIDRLTASTGDSIDLTNPGNEIRSVERITADGVIDIADSLFDFDVSAVDSLGNDVLLTTTGSLLLAETAIMANGASTTLTAGRAILDRDDNPQANVQTGRLQLNAGAEGLGQPTNPVDVVASISVSADTAQANGDVWLANVIGALPVGLIDAGVGDVNLFAQTINDATNDEQTNLITRRLTMNAEDGVGNIQPLELRSVSELTAVTDTGGIELDLTATTDTIIRKLSANAGDILIRHRGLSGDLPVELQSIVTDDGEITIDAGGTITAVEVLSNNVNASDDSSGQGGAESRDITLVARGLQSDILVTTVTARRTADVILVADDDILDTDFLDENLVAADDLRLTANNQSADQDTSIQLLTNISDLTVRVDGEARGDVRIREVDSIRLASSDRGDIDDQVLTTNGSVEITADGSIEVVARENSQIAMDIGGGGFVALVALGDVSDIVLGRGLQTDAGDVRLIADRDVRIAAEGDVASRDGDIILHADAASERDGGGVAMEDGALIDADSGTIEIVADEEIILGGLRSTNDTDDAVRITSRTAGVVDGGDADREIDANSGRVTITAITGIGDGDLNQLETRIARATTQVAGAGQTNLIEDDAIVLESVFTSDGSITIESGGTITALSVVSDNINSSDDVGGDGGAESRDITLIARGMQSDILVTTVTAERNADVFLVADDDILDSDFDDENRVVADDLRLTAKNLFADAEDAVKLSTNVGDLSADVTGDNRGDLRIREVDSIKLASSDQQGDEIVATSNGQIVISAGVKITIVDTSPDDDGEDLKQDPEIVAQGDNGRIDLQANQEIELLDDVQLNSEQVTQLTHLLRPHPEPAETREMPPLLSLDELRMSQGLRSVYLEADSIVFGQRIEINTGVNQGVARIFAPRPIVSEDPDELVVMPAFFDPESVTTNILEQALVNDSTGILTLDIGQSGERGLTVDIDWGATTRQFQQLNGLSADRRISVVVDSGGEPQMPVVSSASEPRLVVEHFYTEADVLDSRENLREAATKPFEVRFSVRHHESILVIGSTIQQAPETESIPVPGQVVSSTDDPATLRNEPSGLENGVASFIIPSLSIPVAFFPVREVIPEFETVEFIVRSESIVATTQSTFETTETTTTSIVSREEYFQIRVLSPDPEGEDLALPEKLPDDILDGDKIKKLFEEVPDGRYEIEYVLGEGNVRSILRVDVRGGKATIPGDELDEDVLELKRIDPEADEQTDGEKIDQSVEESPLPVTSLPTNLDGDTQTRASSLPPVVAGVVLASAWRRRFKRNNRKRLSVAGRFAARTMQSHAKSQ